MEAQPENQDQEQKPAADQQEKIKANEELAKSIPTVTPDTDNLEPGPDKDTGK